MGGNRNIVIAFVVCVLLLAVAAAGGFYFFRHGFSSGAETKTASPKTDALTCTPDSLDLFGRMPDKNRAELAAALLDGVTRDIFKSYLAYQKDPSQQNVQRLQELASQRKKLLVETLQRNPDAAFRSALSPAERDVLGSLTANCVEMPAHAEGKIMVHHADMLDGTENNDFYLLASDGKHIMLHPAFNTALTASHGGKDVTVSGLRIDDRIFFDGNDPASIVSADRPQSLLGAEAHAALSNLGPQRIAVILANFQNTTQPSLTPAQVQTTVFTQVNNYYSENSYNKISLTGAVFGWYTIPLNQTCNDTTTTAAAIAAADPSINYTQYDRVIVVAPMGPSCGYSGIALLGGGTTFTTADGVVLLSTNVIVDSYGTDASAYSHELGHNFGVHHANFYDCGSGSMSGTCTSVEYGSLYSVMGNNHSTPLHMNAPEKKMLGWFGASNILDVTANGTYTLAPLETATAGLQALRVERDSSSWPLNGGLYMEYRQPLGYDAGISGTDVFSGASVNTAVNNITQTQLIDPTPPGDAHTVALVPGTTLTDPATGDTFTTTAANASGATVNVSLCKSDFTAPTVSVTAPTSGSTVSGTITVSASATDASGIQKVEFYSTSTAPFATVTNFPYNATLDTTLLSNGSHGVSAMAYDLSGQGCGSGVSGNAGYSTWDSFSVLNTGDTIPPTVSLTSPADGSTVAYSFTVSANATDNLGIAKVEFYLDAATTPFHIKSMSPYSFPVNGSFLVPTGAHTMYAKAYDLQGNTATSSTISFTVSGTDTTPPNVSLTAPANGAVVSGTIPVSANATDNIGVTKVEFYTDANTTPFATLTTPAYTTTLDTTTLTPGAHTISAKAYDAAGNIGVGTGCPACIGYVPATVSITVDNTPPTASLTAPTNGATVSGTAVALAATASDNIAVQRVDFYRDGTVLLGTDLTSAYSFTWDSTGVANGSHTLFAKATDTAGNSTNSSSVTITVSNGTSSSSADTIPPSVPAGLSALTVSSSQISLSWGASTDNVGVAGYHIYKNGSSSFFATVTGTSYTDSGLSAGTTYAYAVSAYDAAGNVSAKSASVSATTNAITSSSSSSSSSSASSGPVSVSGTIDVALAVTQTVPVTKVEFYTDTTGTPFATAATAPFGAKLNTATLTPGAHTVKARVYYANGQVSNTTGISIMVP